MLLHINIKSQINQRRMIVRKLVENLHSILHRRLRLKVKPWIKQYHSENHKQNHQNHPIQNKIRKLPCNFRFRILLVRSTIIIKSTVLIMIIIFICILIISMKNFSATANIRIKINFVIGIDAIFFCNRIAYKLRGGRFRKHSLLFFRKVLIKLLLYLIKL